jgi:hypothetical protein
MPPAFLFWKGRPWYEFTPSTGIVNISRGGFGREPADRREVEVVTLIDSTVPIVRSLTKFFGSRFYAFKGDWTSSSNCGRTSGGTIDNLAEPCRDLLCYARALPLLAAGTEVAAFRLTEEHVILCARHSMVHWPACLSPS